MILISLVHILLASILDSLKSYHMPYIKMDLSSY